MTPSKKAKSMGLKSLSQVKEMLGTKENGRPVVGYQVLDSWFHNKPILFEMVLKGCVVTLNEEGE